MLCPIELRVLLRRDLSPRPSRVEARLPVQQAFWVWELAVQQRPEQLHAPALVRLLQQALPLIDVLDQVERQDVGELHRRGGAGEEPLQLLADRRALDGRA